MLIRGKDIKITDNVSLEKGLCTFLNPYSYYLLRKNMNIFSNFEKVYCDGILFVTMVRLVGVKVNRVSFDMTSLAPMVFEAAEKHNLTITFIGSEEKFIEKTIKNFKKKFPYLNIVYFHSGFFQSEQDRNEVISQVIHAKPDIVVVGMGAGLQEKFLIDLCKEGWDGYGYTCGGFLHQSAEKTGDYYPALINRFNLRWAYRIYKEPKLFKRYFIFYPKSVFLFFMDFFLIK